MVWLRERSIYAKSIAAIILSNINGSKAIDKYNEILEEIYPDFKEQRAKAHENNIRLVEKMSGKPIFIKTLSDKDIEDILELKK